MKSILKATESITGKQEASLYVSTIGLEEQQKPIVRPHGLPVYQTFLLYSRKRRISGE